MKASRILPLCFLVLPVAAHAQKTIYDIVKGDARFTKLRKLLYTTGLNHNLSSKGPFTLFAPTDAAFKKLPANVAQLITDTDRFGSQLAGSMVLDGKYGTMSFMNGTSAPGQPLRHHLLTHFSDHIHTELKKDGSVTVNGAKIIGEIPAGNGMILIVDSVLPVIIDKPPARDGLHLALPAEILKWGLGRYCDK